VKVLQAFGGPFPQMRFCPTGGITESSAPAYLALANVACVGGSWMLPKGAVAQRGWAAVEDLSMAAADLAPRR
jgi:2-dehydro-3-deoxyphosphogluconate aldolase/(4S)-4-hydroxy-2-oxoglutarate aldolase